MQKKSLITMLAALGLVGTVMVGATVAYLSDTTEEKVNVFTVGDVEIEINEPGWEEEKGQALEYGATVTKDPQITNTGKNDAYVVMEVTGMQSMSQYGFHASFDTENWVRIDAEGEIADNSNALVDGTYLYKTKLATGATTKPLFEEVVFTGDEVEEELEFKLIVKGYAIQTSQMSALDAEGKETDTPDAGKVYAGLFPQTGE